MLDKIERAAAGLKAAGVPISPRALQARATAGLGAAAETDATGGGVIDDAAAVKTSKDSASGAEGA